MLATTFLLITLVAALGAGAWSALAGAVLAVVASDRRPAGVTAAAGGLVLFTASACGLLDLVRP